MRFGMTEGVLTFLGDCIDTDNTKIGEGSSSKQIIHLVAAPAQILSSQQFSTPVMDQIQNMTIHALNVEQSF